MTSIQNQQIQNFVKFLIEFFIKKDQDSFYKRKLWFMKTFLTASSNFKEFDYLNENEN